jgi:hypothetical protein
MNIPKQIILTKVENVDRLVKGDFVPLVGYELKTPFLSGSIIFEGEMTKEEAEQKALDWLGPRGLISLIENSEP